MILIIHSFFRGAPIEMAIHHECKSPQGAFYLVSVHFKNIMLAKQVKVINMKIVKMMIKFLFLKKKRSKLQTTRSKLNEELSKNERFQDKTLQRLENFITTILRVKISRLTLKLLTLLILFLETALTFLVLTRLSPIIEPLCPLDLGPRAGDGSSYSLSVSNQLRGTPLNNAHFPWSFSWSFPIILQSSGSGGTKLAPGMVAITNASFILIMWCVYLWGVEQTISTGLRVHFNSVLLVCRALGGIELDSSTNSSIQRSLDLSLRPAIRDLGRSIDDGLLLWILDLRPDLRVLGRCSVLSLRPAVRVLGRCLDDDIRHSPSALCPTDAGVTTPRPDDTGLSRASTAHSLLTSQMSSDRNVVGHSDTDRIFVIYTNLICQFDIAHYLTQISNASLHMTDHLLPIFHIYMIFPTTTRLAPTHIVEGVVNF